MRALVTGAAGGLGLAIAQRLHADGADVALLDRDPAVALAAEELPGGGGFSVEADVGDQRALTEGFERVLARLGGIDVLVNCAGIGGPTTPVTKTDIAALRRVLDVNLVGAFILSGAAARAMIEQGRGGSIVNIGSILGLRAEANGAPYCMSKVGLGMLTRVMALELAAAQIRVNTVAPGNMATDMHFSHLREIAEVGGTKFEDEVERVRASVPLARHGTGDDVAGAIAWLVSSDASYVTGQTIVVDGGVLLR